MPKYDIQCQSCTNLWEQQRSINAPNPPCPQCGSSQVSQLPPTGTGFTISGYTAKNGYSKGTR